MPDVSENLRERYHHYFARGQLLWARSRDLQIRFPNCDGAEFWRYIDTEAVLYNREIQDVAVPFPPWKEMSTVGGETDLRIFLAVGRDCYDIVRSNFEPGKGKRVLDFGVGCGRTIRHFYRDMPDFELHGCDVDGASIRFLNESIPFVAAVKSENSAPLIYRDEYFDYIYSISVFTHLNKKSFIAWTHELARVLNEGGKAIITLHGTNAVNKMKEPGRIGLINVREADYLTAREHYGPEGFFWAPQSVGSGDIDANQYGISFLDENRLAEFLPPSLIVEQYDTAAISGWQDVAVLRKRK